MGKLKIEVASCESEEAYFSWAPCENCGDTLGGNRYDISYRETLHGKKYQASVCETCVIDFCA